MRERGLSLVEVLIAFTLFVLAMGLLIQVVVPAMRIARQTTERMHRQQFVRVALDRLVNDLTSTSFEGLSVHETTGVSLLATVHPIVSVDLDGNRIWGNTLVLWEWTSASGHLTRSVSEGPAPSDLSIHPFQPLTAEAIALKSQLNESRILLHDVISMSIQDQNPTNSVWDQPLSISLEQKWTDEKGVTSMSLTRQVFLRNI
jgi:Tfp pilus assembly protein PilV